MAVNIKYGRILLKLSGESLAGDEKTGINPEILDQFVEEVKTVLDIGVKVAIVIGGGNIFRGLSENASRMDRVTADQMGMLSTVINSLALKDGFDRAEIPVKIMTATAMEDFASLFTKRKAINDLNNNNVVIIGGGTGNPFFTTDTAAVLRAIEIEADIILKGTRVDGIYDSDPEKNDNAVKLESLSYMDVLNQGLRVMDTTAITLSMENKLPILVFDFNTSGNLLKVVLGNKIGTLVGEK